MKTILITGAGSGLGKLTALVLGKRGYNVIATTETISQAKILKKDALALKIPLHVQKIDITNKKDREKALQWKIDILVNNAAVKEGGSLIDIPEENFRKQFEVNLFSTLLLTQGFSKQMIHNKKGRIVFVSSVSGLMANPFSGPYVSSKFALEGMASALKQELQEHNIEVATINPGPYQTGFNDREFNTWKKWNKDSKNNIFNYNKISFPFDQTNPVHAIPTIVRVIIGEKKAYRNVVPKYLIPAIAFVNFWEWIQPSNWRLGKENIFVKNARKKKAGSDGSYMV